MLTPNIPLPKKNPLKPPSIATMERWANDGVAKATDGCKVEPDGRDGIADSKLYKEDWATIMKGLGCWLA